MPSPFQNIPKDRLSSFKSTGNLTLFLKAKEQYDTQHLIRFKQVGFMKTDFKKAI